MIRRPPRSTQSRSSAASDVYKRQPMPGGALAVKKPYRMALGYLMAAESFEGADSVFDWLDPELTRVFLDRLDPREVEVVRVQRTRGLNAPVAFSPRVSCTR